MLKRLEKAPKSLQKCPKSLSSIFEEAQLQAEAANRKQKASSESVSVKFPMLRSDPRLLRANLVVARDQIYFGAELPTMLCRLLFLLYGPFSRLFPDLWETQAAGRPGTFLFG